MLSPPDRAPSEPRFPVLNPGTGSSVVETALSLRWKMKQVPLILLMLCCWRAPAQTNVPLSLANLYSIPLPRMRPAGEFPEPRLRPLGPRPSDATDQTPSPPAEQSAAERRPFYRGRFRDSWAGEQQTRPPVESNLGAEDHSEPAGSETTQSANPKSIHSGRSDSLEIISRSGDLNTFEAQIYERLERDGYLTRREPPTENLLIRFMDSTFEPEVIRLRKVSVSCSLLTAIKRKNPFCLVNPIFLHVEW